VFGKDEQRNTVYVRLDNGSHLIECRPQECTPLTVPIRPLLHYPEGTPVIVTLSGVRGTIITYVDTDVCLRMSNGVHRWFDSCEVEPFDVLLN